MIPVPAPPGFNPFPADGSEPSIAFTGGGLAGQVMEWIGTLVLVALGAGLMALGVTRVFGVDRLIRQAVSLKS